MVKKAGQKSRQPLFEKPVVNRTLDIITIPDLCKGTSCKICINYCKNGVLELSRTELNIRGNYFVKVVNDAACDECMNCYRHCPEFAIFLKPRLSVSKGKEQETG